MRVRKSQGVDERRALDERTHAHVGSVGVDEVADLKIFESAEILGEPLFGLGVHKTTVTRS